MQSTQRVAETFVGGFWRHSPHSTGVRIDESQLRPLGRACEEKNVRLNHHTVSAVACIRVLHAWKMLQKMFPGCRG